MTKIENWDEVDNQLKRVAELEVAIANINGEVTVECNSIKEEAKMRIDPLQVEKEAIEKQITIYCEANKHEFAEKRSKQFNFGEVAYRVSQSLSLPKLKGKVDALIKAIKAYGLKDCIIYEEKIDKEKLCEQDSATLAKLGLEKKTKDNFRIVPYVEKIAA